MFPKKNIQNENIVYCDSCGRPDSRRKMVINRNKGDTAATHSMPGSSSTVPHTNGYICTVCSHKTCKTRKCLCCLQHMFQALRPVYIGTQTMISHYMLCIHCYIMLLASSCETNQNEHFICNVCKVTTDEQQLMNHNMCQDLQSIQ